MRSPQLATVPPQLALGVQVGGRPVSPLRVDQRAYPRGRCQLRIPLAIGGIQVVHLRTGLWLGWRTGDERRNGFANAGLRGPRDLRDLRVHGRGVGSHLLACDLK